MLDYIMDLVSLGVLLVLWVIYLKQRNIEVLLKNR